MKNITLNYLKILGRLTTIRPEKNTILTLLMLSPLVCFFFLLEWDFHILIFLLLAYGAALTGFLFARSRFGQQIFTEQDAAFYRMVASSTEDLVMICRPDTREMVYITESVQKLLGYQTDSLLNRSCSVLIHTEDRKKMLKFLEPATLQSSLELKRMIRVLDKGQEFRWMELSAKPILNDQGEVAFVQVKFKDVHEQKEMEKVSRIFVEELLKKEPELKVDSQVTDQINMLMTSHELKEPLRTIISYIRYLDKKYKDTLDKEGKECLHFVLDAASRMQDMIEDITDFFKMDGSQTTLKRVDSQKMVSSVIKMLGTRIKERHASIIVGMLPKVTADPRQLQHLFQNLIDNALKYSGEKPEIRISCKKYSNYWEFEVRDNGIGVHKDFQDEIFNPFRRLHTIDQYGGTGIGLTICRKVIDNHNGQLWLRSGGIGKGSRFFFTIPFEPAVEKRSIQMERINRSTNVANK